MLKTICIKGLTTEHSITQITYLKNINQYTTDVDKNYKTNKVPNLKKTYYNLIDDAAINKHNTIYTNDTRNVTKINKLDFNGSNYFTKNLEHTNDITNNITRLNHNNYEHNVIKE